MLQFNRSIVVMKKILLPVCSIFLLATATAQHALHKLWQTDSTWKVPESVLVDTKNNVLYVSNIDGTPGGKDGNGSIGKLSRDGKPIAIEWVKGLNAPKGMGQHGNLLYVADMNEVVVIDIKQGTIIKKIPVEGANFLNDISIGPKGEVYVSDSQEKKVHKIEGDKVSLFAEGFTRPNGVLWQPDGVYVLDNGLLYRFDANGQNRSTIAQGLEGATDGVERVGGKDFIVSCWSGVIYYVHADGKVEKLLDYRNEKINTADIGYDDSKRIVYVPTFFKNSIIAFHLQ